MIIYIKINLVLNNLQRLICHRTQTTNQQTGSREIIFVPFSYTLDILPREPYLGFLAVLQKIINSS